MIFYAHGENRFCDDNFIDYHCFLSPGFVLIPSSINRFIHTLFFLFTLGLCDAFKEVDKKVLAAGIERDEQYAFVSSISIDNLQGFLLA